MFRKQIDLCNLEIAIRRMFSHEERQTRSITMEVLKVAPAISIRVERVQERFQARPAVTAIETPMNAKLSARQGADVARNKRAPSLPSSDRHQLRIEIDASE